MPVIFPEDWIVPVILMLPVPVMSLELKLISVPPVVLPLARTSASESAVATCAST